MLEKIRSFLESQDDKPAYWLVEDAPVDEEGSHTTYFLDRNGIQVTPSRNFILTTLNHREETRIFLAEQGLALVYPPDLKIA